MPGFPEQYNRRTEIYGTLYANEPHDRERQRISVMSTSAANRPDAIQNAHNPRTNREMGTVGSSENNLLFATGGRRLSDMLRKDDGIQMGLYEREMGETKCNATGRDGKAPDRNIVWTYILRKMLGNAYE